MKIILVKKILVIFMAFCCWNWGYSQDGGETCNPHIPNQLILSFNQGVTIAQINSRLINGTIIKTIPADPSSPINIHLAEFANNPGIHDLNGNPQIFNNIVELLNYLEQNEACNSGLNGTTQGQNRVRATDLNYTYSLNTVNNSNGYYDINNYTPASNCPNIPVANSAHSLNINSHIKVAVIDGGYTPSLNYNELVNEAKSYDFIDADYTPNDVTMNNHGNNTLSVITGGISTAVGSNASQFFDLYIYKILDEEASGTLFDLTDAVNRAVDEGVNVINLSVGILYCPFDVCSNVLQSVFDYADNKKIIIVAAAGNDGEIIHSRGSFYIPASLPNSNMIVVGASKNCLTRIADFSNSGNTTIDLFAEGINISTISGSVNGTSFAAPQVSATAALGGGVMDEFNHESVICAILQSTDYKGWNRLCTTGGTLNMPNALNHSCLTSFNSSPTSRLSIENDTKNEINHLHSYFSSGDLLNLSVTIPDDSEAQIALFSISGQLIFNNKMNLVKGQNDLQFDHLAPIPNGLYFVNVILKNEVISKKCYKTY